MAVVMLIQISMVPMQAPEPQVIMDREPAVADWVVQAADRVRQTHVIIMADRVADLPANGTMHTGRVAMEAGRSLMAEPEEQLGHTILQIQEQVVLVVAAAAAMVPVVAVVIQVVAVLPIAAVVRLMAAAAVHTMQAQVRPTQQATIRAMAR